MEYYLFEVYFSVMTNHTNLKKKYFFRTDKLEIFIIYKKKIFYILFKNLWTAQLRR